MIEFPKVSARTLLLTAVVLSAGISPVVSAEEATADQSNTEESADKDADKQPVDSSANNSEVFIPTEEISEDFAVSFPVDI